MGNHAKAILKLAIHPTKPLMATAGACSCSVGSSSHAVSKDDVAGQISTKMTGADGAKPDSVTCPNDLAAKVGGPEAAEPAASASGAPTLSQRVSALEQLVEELRQKIEALSQPG